MRIQEEKGVVLIVVMGVMLILALVSASVVTVGITEVQNTIAQNNSTRAFYLAEAGVERARYELDQDWNDRDVIAEYMGDGAYSVSIYDTDSAGNALSADQLRVDSTGTVGVSRTVEVILTSYSEGGSGSSGGTLGIFGVDSAIETEGPIRITGNAEVTPEGSVSSESTFAFEDIFGVTKQELKDIVSKEYNGLTKYYSSAFNNDNIDGIAITWVSSPSTGSQITSNNWSGGGVFIVEGDLNVTGGTFNGVIWVEGTLSISGNPTINGGIFTESGVSTDTTISGTARINYDSETLYGDDDSSVSSQLAEVAEAVPPQITTWREL